MKGSSRWRGQEGLLGGLDALAFGTLVFLAGTLLVVNAWSVLDTRMALAAAAREAVRTITEAPGDRLTTDPASDGQGGSQLDGLARQATERAIEAMVQHGRGPEADQLQVRFDPLGTSPRCARVTVHVSFRAPVISLPFLGVFRDGIEVKLVHSERIDPYRSGIPGEVACG